MSGKKKTTPKKRPGRKSLLTKETEERILSFIRAGSFDWVAAQAAGIGVSTFYLWMEGRTPRHQEFAAKVKEARAQARLAAEIEVRKTNPEFWLTRGPGKDKPGEPGWGEKTQHEVSGPEGKAVEIEAKAPAVRSDQLADVLSVLAAAGVLGDLAGDEEDKKE